MLDFAIRYRVALDTITSEHDMKLRQFELSEEDWAIAIHLRDVLKVRILNLLSMIVDQLNYYSDFQGRYSFFLSCHT